LDLTFQKDLSLYECVLKKALTLAVCTPTHTQPFELNETWCIKTLKVTFAILAKAKCL